MTDLQKAVALLKRENLTIALCKGKIVYTSKLRGIAPMMRLIEQRTDLKGFSAADKIVGKAAAMLLVLAGIREADTEVISMGALDVFQKYGINIHYRVVTDKIRNRAGDGMCPMEKAVACEDSPDRAYALLKDKLKETGG